MLPKEWASLLRMARRTRLVDRLLDKELGAVGTVYIVAAGTIDFALQPRVPGEAMNLGRLRLATLGADFGLRDWVEHFLLDQMPFVAVGAGNTVCFVLASFPM